MPRIKLMVKPDNTFLNLLLYEGLLTLIQYSGTDVRININEIELPHDALRRVLKAVRDSEDARKELDFVKIGFVGNDLRHKIGAAILLKTGIPISKSISIKNYASVLKYLVDNADRIFDLMDDELLFNIISGNLVIGRKKAISAPQLFKIDRYTGFTSLDANTTYKQYGVRASIQWIIIGILGIMSSYVTQAGTKREFSHHFLFLSPDEIAGMVGSRDPVYIFNIMMLKKKLIHRLREILKRPIPEELLLLKILLDTGLIAELRRLDIDHIAFQLYRIVVEGQTYKIYNTVPIILYSMPYYLDLLNRIARDGEKLVESLRKALDTKSPIIRAIYSFHIDNKYPEADHMVSAIHELYRLIALGDPSGLYGFMRELETASKALEESSEEDSRNRARQYRRIIKEISYHI
ncbi:MAG: hypothetical protein J7K21_00190 [Desulfurococcales archaeon]|nr:hypothetical protein [Desulfurococcales archaeon]